MISLLQAKDKALHEAQQSEANLRSQMAALEHGLGQLKTAADAKEGETKSIKVCAHVSCACSWTRL